MPTPFEILLDPIVLTISGIYALLMIWEGIFPARKLPKVSNWQIKGISSYVIFLLLSAYLPLAYAEWLPTSSFINLSNINPAIAAIAGILVYEFGLYGWHRAMHAKKHLWRVFHQIHHSAERIDTYGAFYFSPMDMIGFTVLGTLAVSVLVGLPPASTTIFLLVTNFFNVFQHANIRTPTWLGYIIQRPESHSIHHQKGVHAYNYSDLPLFDILFGTFRNPSQFAEETGFFPGASSRIKEMLRFKDISAAFFALMLPLTGFAQQDSSQANLSRAQKWLIEPIKVTSLQVNTHPEYNGWGFELGRRLSDKLWLTSMVEKTQGGDFLKNYNPLHDYLISFKYFASITTFRYYLKPAARYSTFFDAGAIFQTASHKFLRGSDVFQEKARSAGPAIFIGGEGRIYKNTYFKWRSGLFINVYNGGNMKDRIDDGQDQPAFFMYPHLADAVIGKGTYAGDLAFGIKF